MTQTKKTTEEEIEEILFPIQSGRNCPEDTMCDCMQKGTDKLLSLFQKYADSRFEQALPDLVRKPNGDVVNPALTGERQEVISEIKSNWEEGK